MSRLDPATALFMPLLLCVYLYGDSSIVLGRLMRLVTLSGNRVSGRIRRKENQPVCTMYVPPSHILQFFDHNKQLNNVCEADEKNKQKLSLRLELSTVVCTEYRFGIGYSVRVPHRSVPEPFTQDKPDDPQKVVSITLFGQIDLGPSTLLDFCRPRFNAQEQLGFLFYFIEAVVNLENFGLSTGAIDSSW